MYIVVLNDGETFTNLKGCKICEVPESLLDLELSKQDIEKLVSIDLEEVVECLQDEEVQENIFFFNGQSISR